MMLNSLIVTSFYYYHKKAIVELWLSGFFNFYRRLRFAAAICD